MFVSKEIEQKYKDGLRRYVTAQNGGMPDRIPIRLFLQEAAALYPGYTNQQVGCDYNLAFEATRKSAEHLGVDAAMLNAIWSNYGVGKAVGLKYFHVPGVDTDINSILQYSEPNCEEDMFLHEDEYDELIDDPTAFLLTKWMPRASSRLCHPGEAVTLDHNAALISGAMAYANYMNAFGPAAARFKYESGIVSANSGMVKAPFDILADKFRGYVDLAIDCIERPDDVYRACEALMPHLVANALAGADPDKNVPITFWAHRGCVPFISMETFDKLYFATLRPVLEEITSKGYQVLFYGEGKWEAHYDALLTLPENSIIYHLDRGDPKAAVKLKQKFAVSGGMSYDVLARGTTDDVRNHLKELFATLAVDGGYILDASALMLNDVKLENLEAAVDYTMEHGVYDRGHNTTGKPVTQRPKQIYDAPAVRDILPPTDARPPFVCRSWEEESKDYTHLAGDVDLVRKSWEAVDSLAYNYVWTTLLW